MKKLIALLLSTLLFTGCTGAPAPDALATNPSQNSIENSGASLTYRQITMEEAITIMAEEENYIILDVRTAEEYTDGHIPHAINIPNEVIGTDALSQLPDKNQLILVYCRSGNRSKQASEKLVKLGYTNVVEFGGIKSWSGEVVTD